MPGLLKQLQRNKPKSAQDERGAVVRSSPRPDADAEAGLLLDSGFEDLAEPDPILSSMKKRSGSDLWSVGTSSSVGATTSDRLAGVSSKSLSADPDSPAWWLSEEIKTNPQVDALVSGSIAEISLADLYVGEERQARAEIQRAVHRIAERMKEDVRVSRKLTDQAEHELCALFFGKGPLEHLFQDGLVSEVFIDHHQAVRAIRRGHSIETPFHFRSAEEYKVFVTALLRSCGRSLSADTPIVDAVVEDQWRTRVNVVHPSLIVGAEPRVCFRIPRSQPISFFDVLQTKTLPATVAAWLAELVALGETNILVVGPEGGGKTVMATALLSAIGSDERVITIEDVPEIQVPHVHLEKMVVLPPDGPGRPGVSSSDLLRAALRRAPHRLVVGELNAEVSALYLNVLESGFAGSVTTLLGDSAENALWQVADLVSASVGAPYESIIRRVSRAFHLIISMRRVDGQPCLNEIVEVLPSPGQDLVLQPILAFAGMLKGKRHWQLMTRQSRWMNRLREKGLYLSSGPSVLGPEESLEPDEPEDME